VPIFEAGRYNDQPYLSMAFVEGSSLMERIRESPLPPREAAGLMKSVAQAIQYAHDRGFLHRDLKPQNILVDEHLRPRVTDFGLERGAYEIRRRLLSGEPRFYEIVQCLTLP
jgi:eukaryotic-like serine/threonine-protein kinase